MIYTDESYVTGPFLFIYLLILCWIVSQTYLYYCNTHTQVYYKCICFSIHSFTSRDADTTALSLYILK